MYRSPMPNWHRDAVLRYSQSGADKNVCTAEAGTYLEWEDGGEYCFSDK